MCLFLLVTFLSFAKKLLNFNIVIRNEKNLSVSYNYDFKNEHNLPF